VIWWPVAIGLLAILSTTGASSLTLAIGQLLLLAVGGLAFLTVVGAVQQSGDVSRIVAAWCAAGLGVSLHALSGAGELAATSGGLTVDGRPTGIFDSPNQLGAYAAMTLMVALGLTLSARGGWLRLLGVATAAASAGALGLSLSRGAWVGGGVAGLLFIAGLPAARRLFGRLVVPTVSVAVIAVGLLLPEAPPQLEVVGQRFETLAAGETSPYDNRDAIYAEAIRQARDAPLLGQGPANFPEVSERAASESSFVGADHAHNTVLNTAAEFGIPVVFLLVGFALVLLRTARQASRRLARPRDRALAAGVGAALVVQVVHGLIDYTLRNATLAVMTWVTAGLIVALARTAPWAGDRTDDGEPVAQR
jgi:O-antigen ligase